MLTHRSAGTNASQIDYDALLGIFAIMESAYFRFSAVNSSKAGQNRRQSAIAGKKNARGVSRTPFKNPLQKRSIAETRSEQRNKGFRLTQTRLQQSYQRLVG